MLRHLFVWIPAMSFATAVLAEQNILTSEEKAAGWQLLFDGTSLEGWHPIGKAGAAVKGWTAQNGTLHLPKSGGGGDIVTAEQFEDFEFVFDWKIASGGNSGVKYNLPDAQKGLGCEYQLLDDEKHPDAAANGRKRHTASLYDVLEPSSEKKLNPPGAWNEARIIVRGDRVEHWLNGAKVLEFQLGSEALKAAIATSKFKSAQGWGVKAKSPLLLQDHGDEVSFRNLKVRKL